MARGFSGVTCTLIDTGTTPTTSSPLLLSPFPPPFSLSPSPPLPFSLSPSPLPLFPFFSPLPFCRSSPLPQPFPFPFTFAPSPHPVVPSASPLPCPLPSPSPGPRRGMVRFPDMPRPRDHVMRGRGAGRGMRGNWRLIFINALGMIIEVLL